MKNQTVADIKIKEKIGDHYTQIDKITNKPINECIRLLEIKYATKKYKKKDFLVRIQTVFSKGEKEAEEIYNKIKNGK